MNNQESCKIAVIGLACFYPGAKSPAELWENILARRQQFREMPELRLPLSEYYDPDPSVPDKVYQNKAAVLDGYSFNWAEKRIPKKSYESTDIVHWLTLDTALKAVEDAGYTKDKLPKDKTGVIIGNTLTGEFTRANQMLLRWPYIKRALRASLQQKGLMHHFDALEETMQKFYKSVFPPITEDSLAGGLANTIAGRVCNYLDLHGGGYIVDGACSSSMLAIYSAANALELGQMDVAIAGGVDISLDTFELIGFSKTGALTRDEMRVYDKQGKGFLPGEGCGVVILKRLEDARRDGDQVYAILNGWGISSDGKGGITAPSNVGQSRALIRAYQKANFDTASLDFIEGHGTGTTVGDKTELEGIQLALNNEKPIGERSCGVTSFKSIVGHTKAAAGIGAFIKTVIALNQRILPPVAGLKEANPIFYEVVKSVYPIMHGEIKNPQSILHAGVSAMGFGGINSHALLQSADAPYAKFKPALDERKLLVSNQTSEVFFFDGKNKEDLLISIEKALEDSKGISYAELADLASHNNKEVDFKKVLRAAVVAINPFDLTRKLLVLKEEIAKTKFISKLISLENETILFGEKLNDLKVGALYPGQGSQRLNMGYKLVERFDWAKEFIEEATEIFEKENSQGITQAIFKPIDKAVSENEKADWKNELKETEIAQPAIILTSLLWQEYLQRLGVKFHAVSGHSLGELMSFHVAGFYDKNALLHFAAFRGKAMARSGSGSMASLLCSKEKVSEYISKVPGYVAVANINGPEQIVISGERESVLAVVKLAEADSITANELPVSAAFHSKLISSSSEAILKYSVLTNFSEKHNEVKLISSVTGGDIATGISLQSYFAEQAVNQVNFLDAVNSLSKQCDLLIEVGPGRVLSGLTNNILDETKCFPVEASAEDDFSFNIMLANLFVRGAELKVEEIYKDRLIREFVPASHREFLMNPLERPFPLELMTEVEDEVEEQKTTHYTSSSIEGFEIPFVNLPEYLAVRGDFLKDVIMTDLKHLNKNTNTNGKVAQADLQFVKKQNISKVYNLQSKASPNRPLEEVNYTGTRNIQNVFNTEEKAIALIAPTIIKPDIQETIYNLVVEKTGFPKDQLEPSLKLLDDLNLDSIKAGSFMAEIAKRYQLQGKFEAAAFANASLQEIITEIEKYVTPDNTKNNIKETDTKQSIENIVIELLAEKTGFPKEAIQPEFKLLDDLNLDSIKAGSVIAQLSKEFNLQGKLEAAAFANASINEIVESIAKAIVGEPSTKTTVNLQVQSKPETPHLEVVNSYSVDLLELPLLQKPNRPKLKNIVLVHSDSNAVKASQISDSFKNSAERVQLLYCKELSFDLLNDAECIVVLIPEVFGEISLIDETVEMLTQVAKYSTYKDFTLAFMQFGDGHFSRGESTRNQAVPTLSAVAFASSLHLERPSSKIRAIEFSNNIAHNVLTEKVLAELQSNELFDAVAYDDQLIRRKMVYELASNKAVERKNLKLSSDDVIVVTGGAKGITAECALAFALKFNCKMALVGSSPLSVEVQETLNKYSKNKLTAKYYACNITDAAAIDELVSKVSNDLGSISGVIHGAGLNKPRRAESVSYEEALKEISPKLIGAANLIQSLDARTLKCFVALTSIIGVTGMVGNSWYAFANEALDLMLRELKRELEIETLTLAYSVWDEVGMGARMGSTKTLAHMGIGAISPERGVEEFLHWLDYKTDDQQVVIAARLGGLDTWKEKTHAKPHARRYLEEVIKFEPGKELLVNSKLSTKDDIYSKDHDFNGSLLFPTVFGLEAMTQAAAMLTGYPSLKSVKFENISLLRPIVIPHTGEITIQVKAKVQNLPGDSTNETRIFASVSTEDSNFQTSHFSAEIILNPKLEAQTVELTLPENALNLDPQSDLYSWLLFQGPTFQNIDKVYTLNEGKVILSTKALADDTSNICFSQNKLSPFIMGSPLLRDVLLQSAQFTLTHNTYLPIQIERWEIFDLQNNHTKRFLESRLLELDDEKAICSVVNFDENKEVLERISGYVCKALKKTSDYPTPSEVASANSIVEKIENRLAEIQHFLKNKKDFVVYKHTEAFNSLNQSARHELEQSVFNNIYLQDNRMALKKGVHEINWSERGKPKLTNSDLNISISHSRTLLLMSIGHHTQGCDIEFVEDRPENDWVYLLGEPYAELLKKLNIADGNCNLAGTRIWSAKETVFKGFGIFPSSMKVDSIDGDLIILSGFANDEQFQVATFTVSVWPKNKAVIATLIQVQESAAQDTTASQASLQATPGRNELPYDPETGKFTLDFQTTFKDCKGLFGKTYFSNFPLWMGNLRELILNPISEELMRDLNSGDYGMVTNFSSVKVYNEASALDRIVGRIWATEKSDFKNSFIDLNFEWLKKLDDGSLVKLADCNLATTWVTIEGHGIVKQSPLPDYFLDFTEKFMPAVPPSRVDELASKHFLTLEEIGESMYKSTAKPRPEILISNKTYQTGLSEGNSVGNLYYSNYYEWQAKTLEQFINRCAPEIFKSQGKAGEYICLEANVNHLQEAMPFEEIEVNMYLEEVYSKGFKLYFEYYSLGGGKRKLAYGSNTIIWAKRKDDKSQPVAMELPKEVEKYLFEFVNNHKQLS